MKAGPVRNSRSVDIPVMHRRSEGSTTCTATSPSTRRDAINDQFFVARLVTTFMLPPGHNHHLTCSSTASFSTA